jgi:F-type H+-transporting ATPase subunit b
MPQLIPTDFAPQIVWLAIVFVVLYIAFSKVALPKIGDVLDARAERLNGDLDRAAELRKRSEATRLAYEAELAKARSDAQTSAAQVAARMTALADQRQGTLTKQLAEEGKAAEARIAQAKTQAMTGLRQAAAELAAAAAVKLTGAAPAPERVVAAVDAALAAERRG